MRRSGRRDEKARRAGGVVCAGELMATLAEKRATRWLRQDIKTMEKLIKELEMKTEILKRLNSLTGKPINDAILSVCKELTTFCTETRRELCQKQLTR